MGLTFYTVHVLTNLQLFKDTGKTLYTTKYFRVIFKHYLLRNVYV